MHKIIEKQLKEACDHYNLSEKSFKAINNILSRKMNGEISATELPNDIARIFELIKSKNESQPSRDRD